MGIDHIRYSVSVSSFSPTPCSDVQQAGSHSVIILSGMLRMTRAITSVCTILYICKIPQYILSFEGGLRIYIFNKRSR